MQKKRLFIGVPPGADELAELVDYRDRMKRGSLARHAEACRWIAETNWHLTLHFLGSVETSRLEDLESLMEAASQSPRHVQPLSQSCVFPDPRHARVAGPGAPPVPALLDLWRRIGNGLETLEFPLEARPYHPHVTMVRFGHPLRLSSEEAEALVPPTPLLYKVEKAVLYESRLTREGSYYAALAEFLLAPEKPA